MANADVEAKLTLRDNASRTFRRASNSIVSDAKQMAQQMLVSVAGVEALRRGIVGSVEAAVEHAGAIRAMEVAGFRNVAMMDRQAEALQRTVGISSDVILRQAAIARQYGATEEAAVGFVEASIDAAAALGRNQDQVFQQLVKTLGGYAGELGEVVPEVKELTKAQLQAGEAAQLMLSRFGGSGQELAQGLSGQLNIIMESFGDLQGAAGEFFIMYFENMGRITSGGSMETLADQIDAATDRIKAANIVLEKGLELFIKYGRGFTDVIPGGSAMRRSLMGEDQQTDFTVGLGSATRNADGTYNLGGMTLTEDQIREAIERRDERPIRAKPTAEDEGVDFLLDELFPLAGAAKAAALSLEELTAAAKQAEAERLGAIPFEGYGGTDYETMFQRRNRSEPWFDTDFNPFPEDTTPFVDRFGRSADEASEGKRELANQTERGRIRERFEEWMEMQRKFDEEKMEGIEGTELAFITMLGSLQYETANTAQGILRIFSTILSQLAMQSSLSFLGPPGAILGLAAGLATESTEPEIDTVELSRDENFIESQRRGQVRRVRR